MRRFLTARTMALVLPLVAGAAPAAAQPAQPYWADAGFGTRLGESADARLLSVGWRRGSALMSVQYTASEDVLPHSTTRAVSVRSMMIGREFGIGRAYAAVQAGAGIWSRREPGDFTAEYGGGGAGLVQLVLPLDGMLSLHASTFGYSDGGVALAAVLLGVRIGAPDCTRRRCRE